MTDESRFPFVHGSCTGFGSGRVPADIKRKTDATLGLTTYLPPLGPPRGDRGGEGDGGERGGGRGGGGLAPHAHAEHHLRSGEIGRDRERWGRCAEAERPRDFRANLGGDCDLSSALGILWRVGEGERALAPRCCWDVGRYGEISRASLLRRM